MNNSKPHSLKIGKASIQSLAIVLFLLIACAVIVFLLISDHGVQNLSVLKTSTDEFSLNIQYFGCNGYSVETVDENEIVYRGEQQTELNEDLGEYCIKITLGDTEFSNKLKSQYSPWETYILGNTDGKLRFIWYPNSGHGIYLYIGSDTELTVDEKEFSELKMPLGNVSINIKIEEDKSSGTSLSD